MGARAGAAKFLMIQWIGMTPLPERHGPYISYTCANRSCKGCQNPRCECKCHGRNVIDITEGCNELR